VILEEGGGAYITRPLRATGIDLHVVYRHDFRDDFPFYCRRYFDRSTDIIGNGSMRMFGGNLHKYSASVPLVP
jgi:hypothetical protein